VLDAGAPHQQRITPNATHGACLLTSQVLQHEFVEHLAA
jgi:hypothetical protein